MFWPCETRTSTCRSFATISSGLYRFLAIAVLLDVKDIPQAGPLQWGWINAVKEKIRNGGTGMAGYKYTLSDADLNDLVSYLREKCCWDSYTPPLNPRYRMR